MAKYTQRCFLVLFVTFVISTEYVGCSTCTRYTYGGTSGVHSYTCCNNCDDKNKDKSCDSTTYHGGRSSNDYCGSCGVPSGGGREGSTFDCGSCSQQQYCGSKCDTTWGGAMKNIPGLCGAYSTCFQNCCEKSQAQIGKRNTDEVVEVDDFCGDGACQSGENNSTCFIDCCKGSECNKCASTSSTSTTSTNGSNGFGIHPAMLAISVLAFALLYY